MMEQEQIKTEDKWLSGKQMLWILFILLMMAAAIWTFNLYRLKNVTVEGLTRYTEAEFKQKLECGFFSEMTPIFCLTDTFVQKEIPFIEKYEIIYTDQHTARVIVHEKRITGCVVIMGRYMFFDKDGIVVESTATRLEGIPVITGLKFNEIVLHQRLQVQKQSLFDTILALTRLIEQNKISVQEIVFDSGYEVTLYLDNITVLLGKRTTYDEVLNALAGILESIHGRTGILDMRNYSAENGEVILKEQ